ncbi:MAG: helix-turn-helix domain-containing protein [Desulfocapsaceae bacterium]|nr:helix-turn-helix domain-containing protein [Desulfocapsaceae bacterium]
MQGSSQLTVKQVATALGIDERSVREKLQQGSLKGMKKTVGQKDQWFVHQRDLDAELARRGISPINHPSQVAVQSSMASESPVAPVIPQTFYQPEAAPPQGYFAPPVQQAMPHQFAYSQPPEAQNVPPVMNAPYKPEAAPASQASAPATPPATEQVHQATATMEQDYEDVTDATVLETRADGSIFENEHAEAPTSGGHVRNWRNEDLEGQVTAAAEKILRPMMDRVQELTKELVLKDLKIEEMDKQLKLLPDFEAQKAKFLREIEAERTAAEIQFNKVKEKEEEAKALEAENALLKQKADEAVLRAEKLADLEKEVQELKKPKPTFWQKLLGQSNG